MQDQRLTTGSQEGSLDSQQRHPFLPGLGHAEERLHTAFCQFELPLTRTDKDHESIHRPRLDSRHISCQLGQPQGIQQVPCFSLQDGQERSVSQLDPEVQKTLLVQVIGSTAHYSLGLGSLI